MRYSEVGKTPLGELAHYGVKGMKWGVRREQKRQAKVNFMDYYMKAGGPETERRIVTPITEAEYNGLSSKPVNLGKNFNRVAANGKTTFRDIAYVSKTEDDRIRYNALIGSGAGGGKGKNHLQLKVQTATDAVSPSMKVRVDTYIETLGQDIPTKNGKSTVKGRSYLQGGDSPYAKSLNDRELGFASYKIWAQQQEGLKTPLETKYFDNLKKKGYNAVIDDADSGIFSDVPIILFPKESGARVTEVKPLTKEDVLDAKLKVKPV